jgi:hypothetical protein
MGDLICNNCQKEFSSKRNYDSHVNNKICIKGKYECKYCCRRFTTHSSMYRHSNHTCKIKQNEDNKRDEIFERLVELENKNKIYEDENKKLKKEISKIKSSTKIINNTQNFGDINNGIINTGTVINNNINLVAYGSEDFSKLDKKEILRILQQGYNSTLKLTEVVHFNPKYPEFQNIYITNMKDKYAMMYDGINWTLTMKDDLISKIYEDKKNYIEENLEDFIDSLAPSQKRALDRWVNTAEDDKKIREIKERIKLLLYNSKQIPIETQRLIDDNKIKILVESTIFSKTKKEIKHM